MRSPLKILASGFASLGIAGVVAFYAMIFALVVGWFINIVKLVFALPGVLSAGIDAIQLEFVLRVVGIPIGPLGGVLGWM